MKDQAIHCNCGNPEMGLNCSCYWEHLHPGEIKYSCEFCGFYQASSPKCNKCEEVSKDQHTPGPWKVWRLMGGPSIVIMGGDCLLAQTVGENDENNARLIVAAPDMLLLLRRLYDVVTVDGIMDPELPEQTKALLDAIDNPEKATSSE